MLLNIISCLSFIQWVISDDSITINIHTIGDGFLAELEKINNDNIDQLDDNIKLLEINHRITSEFNNLEICKQVLKTFIEDKKDIVDALKDESNTLILSHGQSESDQTESGQSENVPAESGLTFNGGFDGSSTEIAMSAVGNLNAYFTALQKKEVPAIIVALDPILKVLENKKTIIVARLQITLEKFEIQPLFDECWKYLNAYESQLKNKEKDPKVVSDTLYKLKQNTYKLALYASNDVKPLADNDVVKKDEIRAKCKELEKEEFKTHNHGKPGSLFINTEQLNNELDNNGPVIPVIPSPVSSASEEDSQELATTAGQETSGKTEDANDDLQNDVSEDVNTILKELEASVAAIKEGNYNFEELIAESKTEFPIITIKNPFDKMAALHMKDSDNRLSKLENDLLDKLLSAVSGYRDQINHVQSLLHMWLGDMHSFDLIVNVLPKENNQDELKKYLAVKSWLSLAYRNRDNISEDELKELIGKAKYQKQIATTIYNMRHNDNLNYNENKIIEKLEEAKIAHDGQIKNYYKSYEAKTDSMSESHDKLAKFDYTLHKLQGFAYHTIISVEIQIFKKKIANYMTSVENIKPEEKLVQVDEIFSIAHRQNCMHGPDMRKKLAEMLMTVYSKENIIEELFKESRNQLLILLTDNDSLLDSKEKPKHLRLTALVKLYFWIFLTYKYDLMSKDMQTIADWLFARERDAAMERNSKLYIMKHYYSQL